MLIKEDTNYFIPEHYLKIITDNTLPVILEGKSIAEQLQTLQEFYSKLKYNIQDLNPQFSKLVDEHFWELI